MKPQPRLAVVPSSLRDANAFVARHHRHHGPVRGHKFAVAVADESGQVRGVAIVGRPCARALQDGWTLEVNRVATDGCQNACSALYGAALRVARAMGFRRLLTYTLPAESGASLRAVGWTRTATVEARQWDRPSRRRPNAAPAQTKFRWEAPAERGTQ